VALGPVLEGAPVEPYFCVSVVEDEGEVDGVGAEDVVQDASGVGLVAVGVAVDGVVPVGV